MTFNKILSLAAIFLLISQSVFADYKISQKTTVEGITTEVSIYSKNVRERRETRIAMDGNAEEAAMMAKMMPNFTEISQCDLRQNVTISEQKKAYFVDYYDWSSLSPEQQKRRPNLKMVIKGSATVSYVVTDSGKRQRMFGLEAKWLKFVQILETSADSCDGKVSMRMEQEGWFIDLTLTQERCQQKMPGESGGCRPRLIMKSMQHPGFFLGGTTTMFENNKPQSSYKVETTALSKAILDDALFEIPKTYREVDSVSELMPGLFEENTDRSATTIFGGDDKGKAVKTVAIDFFSGNASKVNQDELRNYISQKLSASGFSGFPINAQSELANGRFAYVIGVELKKVKELGASKIGGLFGRVIAGDDAAKIGESEAEIVISIYGSDGKTVVASASAAEKVRGKGNDAVKAAIDKVMGGLIEKIK